MASTVEIRSPFLDYNFFQYSLALPDSFRIQGGKNKAILRDAYEDILSPLLVSDKRKQGLSSIKNNYGNSYLEYTHDLYSNTDFLNSETWDGKKISADFELAKNTQAFDKIKQLDVFFRLYEMNNGLLEIKKDAIQKQADESNFIDKPINDFNILN